MASTRTPSSRLAGPEQALAGAALGYPGVVEAGPWGHRAFKIGGKTFLFLSAETESLSFSVKLPASGGAALALPFAEPTHYGLGKAGWVTFRFSRGDAFPKARALAWLDESFRAIAPKKLSIALPAVKPRRSPARTKLSKAKR